MKGIPRMFTRRFNLLSAATLLAASLLARAAAAADSELWTGIPGATTTTNWSDTANWAGASHNANNNNLFFTNNGPVIAGTVDSVVDTSTNCYSLSFTNTTGTHTILILPGQTLTIDGASPIVSNTAASLDLTPAVQAQTTNTITGPNGTLLITGAAAGGISVGTNNGASSDVAPVLDLSGLGTLIISNTSPAAAIFVGNYASRDDGVLNLAMTNYLALSTNGSGNASAIVLGDNTSNNGSSPGGALNLGITNAILADNIGIGLSKQNGALLRFNPAFTNSGANPSVFIRGYSGAAVKKWSIGDGLTQSGTSPAGSGTVDFRNGTVTATVTAMVIGRATSVGTTSPTSTGSLSLSAGSINVVNMTNAMMTTVPGNGASPTNQTATSTVNISGTATLSVNNVQAAIYLGSPGVDTASFNITNGTFAVGTMTLGGGTSTINENNGTLIVTNTVGSPAVPLTALNLAGGTVQLSVNGAIASTNIVATAINTNDVPTTIAIASIGGVTSATTIALMSYSGTDPFGNLSLAPLPNGFTGNLSDDAGKIDLIVSPPAAAASLVWSGVTNAVLTSSWDDVTPDWLDAATLSVPSVYADLDTVTFNDTASNGVVNITTNVAPYLLTVSNNLLNYTFGGTGKVSGVASLIKNGTGTLTLAESGGDSFNGGIIVSNGTLVLDNPNSAISGGLNLAGGTVQVGNNDANGALPSGAIINNGTLLFNSTNTQTISSAITGSGAIGKNNSGTLTLGAISSFAGGVSASAGQLRLSGASSVGAITVNPGGTVVIGLQTLNNIVLAGGTLGISTNLNPFTNNVTVSAGTTSIVNIADPANLGASDASEMAWSNTLSGSGNFIVMSVTNDTSADSGNGFRLRGIGPNSFSGTITLSNDVKGELQTTVAGPYSPAGTGKIVMTCGTYYGTNGTLEPGLGGYCEFNIRDNYTGSTILGNNVQLSGAGYATLDPLGTAATGSTITMGNLAMSGGQELGVYLASGSNPHVVVFPTVTLGGGTMTFSPKTPGFGAANSAGSSLSFGDISETAPSSIIMNGLMSLTLTGNNSYSGTTVVSNGVLEVDGVNAGAGSVTVAAGSLTGVGTIDGPVTVAAGGTLSPGTTTTPAGWMSIASTLTLGGTNIMNVAKTSGVFSGNVISNLTTVTYGGTLQLNLSGDALAAGDAIKLYSCSSAAGAFAAIVPATPGTGLLWDTNTLSTGVLSVVSAVKPVPVFTSLSVSGATLNITATNGAYGGQYVLLGTTNLALPLGQWTPVLTNNFDGSGNLNLSTNVINPAVPVEFFTIVQ